MVKLLFEIWESSDSEECCPVSEISDQTREDDAFFVEAFYASTNDEAGDYWHQRNGWGPFKPIQGVTDQPFTENELAKQTAYLAVRAVK